MRKKIIIIGSGFGGLSAACRLIICGNDVEIFEKLDNPGGCAYTYTINGFTFDGGPSIIANPSMLDDIFASAGKKRSDYFDLIPITPFYRVLDHEKRFFEDGGNPTSLEEQISKWNPQDVEGYHRFIQTINPVLEKGYTGFEHPSVQGFGDMLKIVPELLRLNAYKSVHSFISQFIKDEFLRKVFSFYPLLLGGNPFDTVGISTIIHYMENRKGIFASKGGTAAIVNSLVRLFEELGGSIHYNAEVTEILSEPGRVSGVRLADGSIQRAEVVVCNAEIAQAYRSLISPQYRRKNTDAYYNRFKYSLSYFIIYFGTRQRYTGTQLVQHNIIFPRQYRELLENIFNKKVLSDDLMLLLHIPSLTDPSVAPQGCENFCVLVPVPHLGSGINWAKAARPFRDRVLQFLEENYLPGLRASIIAEHYIDPLHFQNALNYFQGSAFSLQPTLPQSAWFRPHNRSEDFSNLYFVGAGTQPGPGLTGVLTSSRIVEKLIEDTKIS